MDMVKRGPTLTARQALDSCPAAAVFVRLHALSHLRAGSVCTFTDGVSGSFVAEAYDFFGRGDDAVGGDEAHLDPRRGGSSDYGVAGTGSVPGERSGQFGRVPSGHMRSQSEVPRSQSIPRADGNEAGGGTSATGVLGTTLFGASAINSSVHAGQGFNMGLLSGRHATEKTAKATSWAALSGVATYAAFTAVAITLPFTIPVLAAAGTASAVVKTAKFGGTAIEASRNTGEARELREAVIASIKHAQETTEELDFLIEEDAFGSTGALLGVACAYHQAVATAATKAVDALVQVNEAEIPVAIQKQLSSTSVKVQQLLAAEKPIGKRHGNALYKIAAAFGNIRQRLANLCEIVTPEARGGVDGLIFPLQCYAIALAGASRVLYESQEVAEVVECMDVQGSEGHSLQDPVDIPEEETDVGTLQELPEGRDWPREMLCPIMKLPMENPVMTNTGQSYEAQCLRNLQSMRTRDGQPFVDVHSREVTTVKPNRKLREIIYKYCNILNISWAPDRIREWESLFQCPLLETPFKSSSKTRQSLRLSPWMATDGVTYDCSAKEKHAEGMLSRQDSKYVKWVGPNYNVKRLQDLKLNDLADVDRSSLRQERSQSLTFAGTNEADSWW